MVFVRCDEQFMVFVRCRATENYVEQFLFCCPLAEHTTRKERFRKVDFFNKKHQLSRTHCVSVCADGASVMIITKRALWNYEKRRQRSLGSYGLLRREEIGQRKNLRRFISFQKFSSAVNHTKAILYALVCLVLCVARWGRTQRTFVSFVHPFAHEDWGKMLERFVHAGTPVRYWKNRITTLLNDSSTASGLWNGYFWHWRIYAKWRPWQSLNVRPFQ